MTGNLTKVSIRRRDGEPSSRALRRLVRRAKASLSMIAEFSNGESAETMSCQMMQTVTRCTDTAAPQVLVVGPLHPAPLTGGIETQLQYLLESDLAGQVGIQLFNTARREDPSRRLCEKLGYQLRSCGRFVATLRRQRPRVVQIMTASYLNFFQNAAYALIARCYGKKVLLYIHGGGFKGFFAQAGVVGRVLIRASLKLPHAVLATSNGWASYFQSVSTKQRVCVVPNGLPVNAYAHAGADRARFGIGTDRVAILFMGGRSQQILREKGFPELVQAIAIARRQCPAVMLVAAGPVCDTESLTKVLGPEHGAWIAVGPVSGDAKTRLYRSVDIFALPSRIENMPNTVMEAMAAGLPVVATPVGAIPEMVEQNRNGFIVELDDISGLAAKLVTLGLDGELRTTMGARSLDLARRKFDFSATKQRLLDEYRRLGAVGPRPTTAGGCREFEAEADVPKARYVWHRHPAVQRPLQKLARVFNMGPAEIAHRLRLRFAKSQARLRTEPNLQRTRTMPPFVDHGSNNTARYLKERKTRGFFDLDAREHLAARIRARLPAETERTVGSADALLTNGIVLLGKHFRPAADDIDWLADPDHGRIWPFGVLHDTDVIGDDADVKFVWELNRQQYLTTLGRAYVYTGDERYAAGCVRILRSWISANPCPLGVNWISNLEVAIRSISWLWCLQFLIGCRALSEDDLRLWLGSLREHFDHLQGHLSTYTDPTNHLIGEATALALIALWCPEWDPEARRRTNALEILDREAGRQVEEDGIDKEQSISYQRFVLDLLLQVIALAERNSVTVPGTLRARAAAMLDAVRIMLGPALRAPRIGDSDDARGVPFFTADPWDFRELLALGQAVLGTHLRSECVDGFESSLWMAASEERSREASSRGTAADAPRPAFLARGGYVSLWSRRREARDRLLFDCGPLGYQPNASHGHADLLSILVEVDGEELLIDPGTFAYQDKQGRREVFRATRSHNTIEIGGRDQADAVHPFKWLNIPQQGVDVHHFGADFDYVEAWHDGYRRIRPCVRHRRGILALDGGWLVVDWLEGKGRQRFVRWFHAAPHAVVQQLDASRARICAASGKSTLFVADIGDVGEPVQSVLETGIMPYSEQYARSVPAPAFRYVDVTQLPAIRLTLLVPGSEPENSGRTGLQFAGAQAATAAGGLRIRLCDASGKQWQVEVYAAGAKSAVGRFDAGARIMIADHSEEGQSRCMLSF